MAWIAKEVDSILCEPFALGSWLVRYKLIETSSEEGRPLLPIEKHSCQKGTAFQMLACLCRGFGQAGLC
jgi:hypothetical protein